MVSWFDNWTKRAVIVGAVIVVSSGAVVYSASREPGSTSGGKRPAVRPPVAFEPSTLPVPKRSTLKLAKHEPVTGCYLGAYIDLDETLPVLMKTTRRTYRDPTAFEKLAGRPHAMYFFYMGYGRELPTEWVKKLASMGKFVHIALEPNKGLDAVQDDAYLRHLADELNASGAKVFLRFASEMNGDWVKYWGNPKKYIEKWRLVHRVMASRAPRVAMVWCPYAIPVQKALPYYPGDEYVDWVGVNMYSVTYYNQNPETPARHVSPVTLLDYVYSLFADRKPIMICEYGATHYSALEDAEDVEFAQKCIATLYRAIAAERPEVKAINYFNTNNMRVDHRRNNDYSLTSNADVMQTYRQEITSPHFLSADASN